MVVVYNGAIYNFRDLQEELRARGHRFRSASDTEVIVHAWEEWGEACVGRLRGMFAFALWDARQQTLFLARDRLGDQAAPLRHPAGRPAPVRLRAEGPAGAPGSAAADRPLCGRGLPRLRLCARPEDDLSGRPQAAARALAELARRPERAAPGALLAAALRRTRGARGTTRRRGAPGAPGGGGGDAPGRRRAARRLSVRRHRFQRRGRHDEPARGRAGNTCSIGFDQPDHDETAFARQVAAACNARTASGGRACTMRRRSSACRSCTTSRSPTPPRFRPCSCARSRGRRSPWPCPGTAATSCSPAIAAIAGTCTRSGCGRRCRPGCVGRCSARSARSTRSSTGRRSPCGCRRRSPSWRSIRRTAYFHSVAIAPEAVRRRLYSPALRSELQGYGGAEVIRAHWRESGSEHPLDQAQYVDLMTYLPGDILTKVDRASMAHALEVRVPLLDHVLVEWAATLPPRLRLNARGSKYVLKQALRPHLPAAVLRRRKMGFAVPLAAWLRGSLMARGAGRARRAGIRGVRAVRSGGGRTPDRAAPERAPRPQPDHLGAVHVRRLPRSGARSGRFARRRRWGRAPAGARCRAAATAGLSGGIVFPARGRPC